MEVDGVIEAEEVEAVELSIGGGERVWRGGLDRTCPELFESSSKPLLQSEDDGNEGDFRGGTCA
jgi:hypothetical protein